MLGLKDVVVTAEVLILESDTLGKKFRKTMSRHSQREKVMVVLQYKSIP